MTVDSAAANTALEPQAVPAEPGPPRPAARTPWAMALRIVEQWALLILLGVVVLFFAVWSRTSSVFFSVDDFRLIGSSQAVLAILALGTIVPLICGQFDFSVGAVAGLSSVLTAASFAHAHFPLVAGLAVGVAVGTAVGVVNGFVVTRFGVNAFIATLGSASVLTGIVNWYTQGLSIIQDIPSSLTDFGSGNWLGIPRTVYLLVVVALAVYYLLDHTPFGRFLHSVGSNAEAARLVGLRVPRIVFGSFVVSGTLAGVAGVLLLAQSGAGNPQVGNGLTLTAFSAAFLGATTVRPGRFNVLGTLVAIFFIAVSITGLTFAGASNYINDLFTGGALIFAVTISAQLGRRRMGAR